MPPRADTEPGLEAVPRDQIEEITDRIDMLVLPKPKEMTDDELNAVMASFEEQLLRLNQTLQRETDGKIQSLSVECKRTEEVIEGLNSAIDERLKGHG